jgi:hypothetical protein
MREKKSIDIACIQRPDTSTAGASNTSPAVVIQTLVIHHVACRAHCFFCVRCTCTKPQLCNSRFFPGQRRYHLVRWIVVPWSTDSKTKESLTHPTRVALRIEDEYTCDSLSQTGSHSMGRSARDKMFFRFLPTPVDRRMTARDQKWSFISITPNWSTTHSAFR